MSAMKKVIVVGYRRYAVMTEKETHYECKRLNRQGRMDGRQQDYLNIPKDKAALSGFMFPADHPVAAYSGGLWQDAVYDSIGSKPGEHWVKIGGVRTKIINDRVHSTPARVTALEKLLRPVTWDWSSSIHARQNLVTSRRGEVEKVYPFLLEEEQKRADEWLHRERHADLWD